MVSAFHPPLRAHLLYHHLARVEWRRGRFLIVVSAILHIYLRTSARWRLHSVNRAAQQVRPVGRAGGRAGRHRYGFGHVRGHLVAQHGFPPQPVPSPSTVERRSLGRSWWWCRRRYRPPARPDLAAVGPIVKASVRLGVLFLLRVADGGHLVGVVHTELRAPALVAGWPQAGLKGLGLGLGWDMGTDTLSAAGTSGVCGGHGAAGGRSSRGLVVLQGVVFLLGDLGDAEEVLAVVDLRRELQDALQNLLIAVPHLRL